MPWVKSDDGLPEHPKTRRLTRKRRLVGLAAGGLHHYALCNSSRYLLDGQVPTEWFEDYCDHAGLTRRERTDVLNALLDSGQWTEHPEDGWQIHDYLDWNPSREKVQADRARDAERKARGRGKPSVGTDPGPDPESAGSPPVVRPDSARNPLGVRASRPDPSHTRPMNNPPNPPGGGMGPGRPPSGGRGRDREAWEEQVRAWCAARWGERALEFGVESAAQVGFTYGYDEEKVVRWVEKHRARFPWEKTGEGVAA